MHAIFKDTELVRSRTNELRLGFPPSPAMALIKRELLATLRGRRAYLFLMLMLAIMTGVLFLYLHDIGQIELSNSGGMADLTTTMFYTFGYGLYLAAVLLVPPIAAGSICTEKQQEQLDLVRMTYIRPSSLLFGKFVNILGLYGLVAIATLPFAGVMLFFTGLDAQQYVQVLLLLLFSAASATMLGLYFSARLYRTIPAVLVTYVFILLTQFALAILFVFLIGLTPASGPGHTVYEWADPLFATCLPCYGITMMRYGSLHPLFYIIAPMYHIGLVLGFGYLARRILDRPTEPMKVNSERTIADPALLEQRRKQFPFYLIDPQRRRALIGDRQNPVLVKERYTGLASRGTTAIRILYITAIAAVITGAFTSVIIETSRDKLLSTWGFLAVETLLLLGIAPSFMATAFSKEREWGNWDMLRMTLLTPRQVVLGKLMAALQSIAFPAATLLIATLPLLQPALRDSDILSGWAFGTVMMGVTLVYAISVSLVAALHASRSLSALLWAYGVCLAILVALPILVALLEFDDIFRQYVPRYVALWLSPLTMPILSMEGYISPLAQPYVWSHIAAVLALSGVLIVLSIYWCAALWRGPRATRTEVACLRGRAGTAP